MKLSNKTVIITGGSGLIGRSIINFLLDEGATVINLDIISYDLDNSKLIQYNCNILEENELVEVFNKVKSQYPVIDGLINNAYPRTSDWGAKFEDVKVKSLIDNITMQIVPHFRMCQLVAEVMKLQQSGCIVNIGSIYGIVGPDFSVYNGTNMTMPAAYSIIKGGMINFTRYLSSYLGEYNVRVNAISPGGIFDNQNETFVRQYENKTPLKRMGTPNDIGPSVVFLLSEDSKYISGQNIVIDGGWTAI